MLHRRTRALAVAILCLAAAACGPSPLTLDPSTMPSREALRVADSAEPNAWTWIDVPNARCANGSSTGFAVNLNPNSNRLVVLYEGGGACFDTITCHTIPTAAYVTTGYNEDTFRTHAGELERLQRLLITDRADAANPFADASYAYVPYCTGDVHSGTQPHIYPGAKQPTYHVGFTNGQTFTNILAQTLPQVEQVWVAGGSAGGFGATFHFADTQAQFPQAVVNLIDDSGESFPNTPAHKTWGMHLPEGCQSCNTNDFTSLVRYYSSAYPQSRFATLSYSDDKVLPLFFGMTENAFAAKLLDYESMLDTLPNARYFVYKGRGHVLLHKTTQPSAGGENLSSWLSAMVNDAPWDSRR